MRSRIIEVPYYAPQVEVFEVLVEQGFVLSAGNEPLGDKKEDIEW